MAAHQAPPSLGFSRQEYWSGLPFPSPMHENESEVAPSCLTPRDPMDCSLPGSSVHGIFQARVLEWCPIAFSGLAWLRSAYSVTRVGLRILFISRTKIRLGILGWYFLWGRVLVKWILLSPGNAHMGLPKLTLWFPSFSIFWASQVALVGKNLPANAGDIRDGGFKPWVGKIPWRSPWQPSSILAWRIPWTEDLAACSP